MKFSIDKRNLKDYIHHLYSIVPTKNAMPILSNFLIEANEEKNIITVTATDLDITVVVDIPANVITDGKVCIPGKNFNEIISVLPDGLIQCEAVDEHLMINCGPVNFNILCADTSSYPIVTEQDMSTATPINASLFSKMIENTSFAVSTDQNRIIFTGLYWKILPSMQVMAATDGKRVAEFKLLTNHAENGSIQEEGSDQILPIKGLNFLQKIIREEEIPVQVLFVERKVAFQYDNVRIYSTVIDGHFPDYTKVFPMDFANQLLIDRDLLREAIKRMSLFATEETSRIIIDITAEKVIIHSVSREVGSAKEEIDDFDMKGENVTLALNFRYVNSILNVIETDDVLIKYNRATDAVLFFNTQTNEQYESRFLLMPLRT